MSKVKTPREKKMLSLLHDRRNVYGENDKASRKNIPLRKQQRQQELRRAANQSLRKIECATDEDMFVEVEQSTRDVIKQGERKLFRKSPDASLAAVLEHKRSGDWKPLIQPWSKL